jgi:rSAM/selenodomain-associated transferase 1
VNAIVLLARAPSAPGKTRLTSSLPVVAAVALRRALFLDTYEAVRIADATLFVAFTPDNAREEFETLLADSKATLIAQRGEDLGARMHAAMVDAFAHGARQVALVGSDLPTLPPSHLTGAFSLLDAGRDLVLGPSEDGGYCLVAMRRAEERLFQDISWGSPKVLGQTVAIADTLRLSTALIEPWFDVDTREDLMRVANAPRPGVARHTREWLRAVYM